MSIDFNDGNPKRSKSAIYPAPILVIALSRMIALPLTYFEALTLSSSLASQYSQKPE